MNKKRHRQRCEVCGSSQLIAHSLGRRQLDLKELSSRRVQVTNKDYGVCLPMVKCAGCGLVQVAYRLQAKDIVKLYSQMDDVAYLKSSQMRSLSNYLQVEPLLKKYLPTSGQVRLLEIGAGSGGLLHLLKVREGYCQVTGVEPSQKFVRFAREHYGLKLIRGGFEDLKPDTKYQTILALDVIEHTTSPGRFMRKLDSLLVKGGIGIISTPDIGSLPARLLGWRWWHVRPPHLYYFTGRNFALLAQQQGIPVVTKHFFTWRLPLGYLVDSFQRLLFKRPILSLPRWDRPISLTTFDSYLYVVQKI